MSRTRTLLVLVAVLAAATSLVAGCGDDSEDVTTGGGVADGGGDAGTGVEGDGDGADDGDGPTSGEPGDPVLLVELTGAFTTAEMSYQMLPSTAVYESGLAIQPAPHTMEYPGPALPPLNALRLGDEALAAIEDAAVAAGLDTDDVDYGEPPVADAGTTVVTVEIGGETYVHRADALGLGADGLGGGPVGLTDEQVAAREALQEFLSEVTDLTALAGDGDEGEAQPFTAERFRLWVRPASEVDAGVQPDPDQPEPTVVEWTVSGVELSAQRCLPVEGDAAEELAVLLADADSLTRFESGGETWAVVARPVLPHEPTCPEE